MEINGSMINKESIIGDKDINEVLQKVEREDKQATS